MREVRATVTQKKPVLLMHEADPNKGGLTVQATMEECPEEMRGYVFYEQAGECDLEDAAPRPRQIITWHRIYDFQHRSLLLLAQGILANTPIWAGHAPPPIFIPGEIERKAFHFKTIIRVYASPNNPGALRVSGGLQDASCAMRARPRGRAILTSMPLAAQHY